MISPIGADQAGRGSAENHPAAQLISSRGDLRINADQLKTILEIADNYFRDQLEIKW
jgi:hypothetical protein